MPLVILLFAVSSLFTASFMFNRVNPLNKDNIATSYTKEIVSNLNNYILSVNKYVLNLPLSKINTSFIINDVDVRAYMQFASTNNNLCFMVNDCIAYYISDSNQNSHYLLITWSIAKNKYHELKNINIEDSYKSLIIEQFQYNNQMFLQMETNNSCNIAINNRYNNYKPDKLALFNSVCNNNFRLLNNIYTNVIFIPIS